MIDISRREAIAGVASLTMTIPEIDGQRFDSIIGEILDVRAIDSFDPHSGVGRILVTDEGGQLVVDATLGQIRITHKENLSA